MIFDNLVIELLLSSDSCEVVLASLLKRKWRIAGVFTEAPEQNQPSVLTLNFPASSSEEAVMQYKIEGFDPGSE
ncbi:hypothetical protein [Neorhodopirellula lusitana]|uniref:hypothetical protein n=1 Tax=Neorhodopirellula lusitana TaxID=445327 RepID=UPI0024B724C3|nr:hypothetical protein [Neorhodopirellula lusitana]